MLRLCLILTLAVLPLTRGSHAAVLNGVAAIVNDAIITYDEVQREVEPVMQAVMRQFGTNPSAFAQARERVLREGIETLVQRKLILDAFEKAGYVAIDNVIEDVIAEQIREDFATRVEMVRTLKDEGRTLESYRKEIRDKWVIDVMTSQNVRSEVLISPYKIQRYYLDNIDDYRLKNQVKLRMIVVSKSKHGEAAQTIADEIATKLDEGVPFSEMAKIYSDGSHRSEGGDVGWIEDDFLREDLSEEAFALAPGKRSDFIDRPEAIYIMLVESKRAAHVRPLEEVRDEIEATLEREERARLTKKWIDGLKEKAFIRYF